MVTHDVALKTFANRVVRMADGKISKIQDIPVNDRQAQINHLNARVAQIHSGGLQDELTIREGIADQDDVKTKIGGQKDVIIPQNIIALKGMNTVKTSVRKPHDYPMLKERFNKHHQ